MDICLCASKECPKYNDCLRGGGNHYVGICTMSYLSEVCNKENDYAEFIGEGFVDG